MIATKANNSAPMCSEQKLQIVIPQGPGGIADYAHLLARAVVPPAIVTEFLSHGAWEQSVMLQYSGYGYAKRGAPLWLIPEVERLKKRGHRLGIFFHELYASGAPWRSSFWMSPLQRFVAQKLVSLSDYWLTNREQSGCWLRNNGGDRPFAVLPTFSNVGELVGPFDVRIPKAVIFGSASVRTNTYRRAGDELYRWAHGNGIEIHDIGPPLPDPEIAAAMDRGGVLRHGMLSADEVDAHLSNAQYGLLAYPADFVAKSGVFAAYCAHAVCPILLSENLEPGDGLVRLRHYVDEFPCSAAILDAPTIAQQAWNWYQPHRIAVHAQNIEEFSGMVATGD